MNGYILMNKLGQGAFSTVHKVKRKEDGKEYAMKKMKIMNFSEKEIANCLNEVRILASIENPSILDYKDSFFDQLTNTFCIVTQYLEGGDVFQVINKHKKQKKPIEQALIWKVAFGCLKGLETLHQMSIMHRDIKSANIFLSKDQKIIKLADLNVSVVTQNGMARTQTGTPYYASPEVWLEKPYSSKCDIWSLGCVLYEMATLRPPFMSHDLRSLKKTIIAGNYKKIPPQYSSDLESLIKCCLKTDPKERLSAQKLLDHELILKRASNYSVEQNLQESAVNTSFNQRLIGKILPPKKRQFKSIKERLPKNRFDSLDKVKENRSFCDSKEKENIVNFTGTNRITKKEVLPSIIKRSSSLNNKIDKIRVIDEKLRNCDEKPPLPKKPIRA